MKTLGHSQIGLTMNTYTYVLPEIGRGVIDAAARVIFERRASRKPWLHSWLHCGRPGRIYESPDWA